MGKRLARLLAAARARLRLAAHVGCILGGWALLTHGIAALTVPEAWPISGGLFLLSLAGWGHLRVLFAAGYYALYRAGQQ